MYLSSYSFNSKLVRLKAQQHSQQGPVHQRFNSKLVRLKVDALDILLRKKLLFQFQTGAIKSWVGLRSCRRSFGCFNSKLVRLKAHQRRGFKPRLQFRFNSKLVRLKVAAAGLLSVRSILRFNSKLVRLKAIDFGYDHPFVCLVSIPNWCD